MSYDCTRDVAEAFEHFRDRMAEIAKNGASAEAVLARKGISDEQRSRERLEYELGYESDCWAEAIRLIEARKAKLDSMLDEQSKKRDASYGPDE